MKSEVKRVPAKGRGKKSHGEILHAKVDKLRRKSPLASYVLGFAFNQVGDQVMLIKKDFPEKGKWNGMGGQINGRDESPVTAIERTFQEETGKRIRGWSSVCLLTTLDHEVCVFSVFSDAIFNIVYKDNLFRFDVKNIPDLADRVQDIPWLIAMALSMRNQSPRPEYLVDVF